MKNIYVNGENYDGYTFNEIAEICKENGLKSDKVSVGIWAKSNGYKSIRKTEHKIVTRYYYKEKVLTD